MPFIFSLAKRIHEVNEMEKIKLTVVQQEIINRMQEGWVLSRSPLMGKILCTIQSDKDVIDQFHPPTVLNVLSEKNIIKIFSRGFHFKEQVLVSLVNKGIVKRVNGENLTCNKIYQLTEIGKQLNSE